MQIYGWRLFVGRDRKRSLRITLLAMLLVQTFSLPALGIVRRRLNVNSNPPGALVYVDNQQIGTTPCSVDFVYYGTREIRLIKPGFETLTVNQPIPTPWYEIPGIDFISENLVPTKIRDNRTVSFNLSPQLVVPTPELLNRADQLRQETQQFQPAPIAAGPVVGTAPPPTFTPGPPISQPPVSTYGPTPAMSPPPFGPPAIPQATPNPTPTFIPAP